MSTFNIRPHAVTRWIERVMPTATTEEAGAAMLTFLDGATFDPEPRPWMPSTAPGWEPVRWVGAAARRFAYNRSHPGVCLIVTTELEVPVVRTVVTRRVIAQQRAEKRTRRQFYGKPDRGRRQRRRFSAK